MSVSISCRRQWYTSR